MSNRSKIGVVGLLLPSLFVFGCAALHSPPRWLEEPKKLQTDTYGGWIYLKTKTTVKLEGELIAVGADSIYVANEAFHAVARSDIKSARLEAYESNAWLMTGWTLLGTLCTASHGIYLALTAPMWILGGGTATIWRSYDPIIEYPDREWSNLQPYARFPQGLPLEINRRTITVKRTAKRRTRR